MIRLAFEEALLAPNEKKILTAKLFLKGRFLPQSFEAFPQAAIKALHVDDFRVNRVSQFITRPENFPLSALVSTHDLLFDSLCEDGVLELVLTNKGKKEVRLRCFVSGIYEERPTMHRGAKQQFVRHDGKDPWLSESPTPRDPPWLICNRYLVYGRNQEQALERFTAHLPSWPRSTHAEHICSIERAL